MLLIYHLWLCKLGSLEWTWERIQGPGVHVDSGFLWHVHVVFLISGVF